MITRNSALVFAALLLSAFAFTSCKKYTKICHDTLSPRVEEFAEEVAESCDGDPLASQDFFAGIPNKVCGKRLAKELAGHKGLSQEQVALVACPIVVDAAVGLGELYVAKAIKCKKPLDMVHLKTLANTTLCALF